MRRRLAAAVIPVSVIAVLAGCTPTVVLQPQPQATSVGCASVVVRLLNQSIGSLQPRNTDQQGTFAWGDPLAVTLYCGVAAHPTDDPCFRYDGVDWKRRDETRAGASYEVLTTVGRVPVVQMIVNTAYASDSDALPVVSDAVRTATARRGLGCTVQSAPSASPSP